MTFSAGSRLSRRAALLSFAAIVALALLLGLAAAVSAFMRNFDRAVEMRDRAMRYERIAVRLRTETAALAHPAQVAEVEAYFHTAPNVVAAAAQIQQRLSNFASLRALSVQKLAATPTATAPGEVTVEIAILGDLADVSRFLIELKDTRPRLLVESMTVTRLPGSAGSAAKGSPAVGLALVVSALSDDAAAK